MHSNVKQSNSIIKLIALILTIVMAIGTVNVNVLAEDEQTTAEKYAEIHAYAQTLQEEEYTAESWSSFATIWSAVSSIYDVSGFSEAVQINFYNKLESAIDGLVKQDTENSEDSNILKDSMTGVEVRLDKAEVIPENSYLEVTKYNYENWKWDYEGSWSADIPITSLNYVAFGIAIKNADGEIINMQNPFEIVIPIDETIDLENLSVTFAHTYNLSTNEYNLDSFNSSNSGSKTKLSYEIDNETRTLTLNTGTKYYLASLCNVFLYNKLETINPQTLSNGVYQVDAQFTKSNDAALPSMSNAALKHDAYLVKSDEGIYIYLEFSPILFNLGEGNFEAYIGGVWCDKGQSNDGEIYADKTTFLSYYVSEDGELLSNSGYNPITEIACPKALKLELVDDCYNTYGGYTLAVSSPVMAAMNNLSFDEIIPDDLTINLMISQPNFLGSYDLIYSELPQLDKSALKKEIELAKTYDEDNYTSDSYSLLMSVVSEAQVVYNNSSSASNYEEQINFITNAINNLVINDTTEETTTSEETTTTEETTTSETDIDYNNLPDGKYIVNAEMKNASNPTDYSMSNNAIDHELLLEVIDGEYFVTMHFKGLSIFNQLGYLSELSYYDGGYNGGDYQSGNLVSAEVLSVYDVIDVYNDADNPYPEYLKVKLVDKASEEYVPMQVFVPVMEAISTGSGTQNVLMSIDWTTLEKYEEPVEKGDLTGDGIVDKEDLTLMKKVLINLPIEESGLSFEILDVNEDGKVNALDLVMLKKQILNNGQA